MTTMQRYDLDDIAAIAAGDDTVGFTPAQGNQGPNSNGGGRGK